MWRGKQGVRGDARGFEIEPKSLKCLYKNDTRRVCAKYVIVNLVLRVKSGDFFIHDTNADQYCLNHSI